MAKILPNLVNNGYISHSGSSGMSPDWAKHQGKKCCLATSYSNC